LILNSTGVESEGQTARAKFVVGDPSYFPEKVHKTSSVVRAICILSHPIPSTDSSHSVQIILPQRQVSDSRQMILPNSLSPSQFSHAGFMACDLKLRVWNCRLGRAKSPTPEAFPRSRVY